MIAKKILCTFLIMVNILCLSGCWGYKEINELPIVIGAGIDKINNEEYLVTAEILRTPDVSGDTSKTNTILLQTKGKTIFDAIRNLTVKSGKFLYWANMKVILIGKDIAEEDIVSVLDLFYRDIEVRAEGRVIIAKDKAEDIFKENQSKGEAISARLLEFMDNSDKSSKIYPLKLYEVIDLVALEGSDFILPIIASKDVYEKNKSVELESAVLKKNKMIGTLTGEEVQTYRLLLNKERGGIRVDQISKDKTSKISYEIEKSKVKTKPIYENGKITMNIAITTDVFIAEVMNYKFDFTDENTRKYMEESLEESIRDKSKELLSKIQGDLNSDILGFGQLTKVKYPNVWRKEKDNWDKIFPNIAVDINVKVNFKGSALYSRIIE